MLFLFSFLQLLLTNPVISIALPTTTLTHPSVECFHIPHLMRFDQQDCYSLLEIIEAKPWFSIDTKYGPLEPEPGTTPIFLYSGTCLSRILDFKRGHVPRETTGLSNNLSALRRTISEYLLPGRGNMVGATGIGVKNMFSAAFGGRLDGPSAYLNGTEMVKMVGDG